MNHPATSHPVGPVCDDVITAALAAASDETAPYSDLFDYPYSGPRYHPRMSPEARAAQFAPFAALPAPGSAAG